MIQLIAEFTATNIIPLWIVIICLIVGIMGAIVGLMVPWFGFITLGIDLTILWDFLFNANVTTGYVIDSSNQIITLVEKFEGLRIFAVIILLVSLFSTLIGAFNKYME